MTAFSYSVAVLIVNWNGKQHLASCLDSLARQEDPGCKWSIWMFDNGSVDGSVELVKQSYPHVKLVAHPVNIGFAEAVNNLINAVDANACVMLNNDTAAEENWLKELVHSIRYAPDDVAAVAGMSVSWDGACVDFLGGSMTFDGHAFQKDLGAPISQVTVPPSGQELLFANGANMAVKKDAFQKVGGLDHTFFAYFEDVDLSWRFWAQGYRVVFEPNAVVNHRNKATSNELGTFRRGALYQRNALLNAYKNFDQSYWADLMPLILLTTIHRTQKLLTDRNHKGHILDQFPISKASMAQNSGSGRSLTKIKRWFETSNWIGMGSLRRAMSGLQKQLPSLLGKVHLTDPWSVSQLQAISGFYQLLDSCSANRKACLAARVRSDGEIFEKFPLFLKASFPGDEDWFQTSAFQQMLDSMQHLPIKMD